jgi:FtsH-binding integral membrane protein
MSSKNSNARDMKILETMTNRTINKVPDNTILLKIFCCLVIIVLICIAIGHYAFKNGILTCDHYILNTYLYVILAIVLIFMLVLLNDKFGVFNSLLDMLYYKNNMPFLTLIIILIIFIALGYALAKINPQNIIASNAIWLMLILFITIIILPVIYFGKATGVVGVAGLITVGIVIATGLLGYYYGDVIITFDWDFYLVIALIALIVVSFVAIILAPLFIKTPTQAINFIYIISIIGLIIFVLLLLSYQKKLKENANKCIDGQMVPNYPLESWKLVIKIVNVFTDLLRILGIRKLRNSGSFRLRK